MFRDNSRIVDLIIISLFAAYFIVGFDLSKEMAKGEFIFFACILSDSQEADTAAFFESMIFDLPLLGIILTSEFFPQQNDVNRLFRGRAPPELSV
ncbi:MAG: hypothetical protein UZ05_CHB002000908 [Chlorobi bacterium OLB5]|nr:MAG: hypothetical protein UZ05_CHB002000908 [Chlorobi bacterium OLB5]